MSYAANDDGTFQVPADATSGFAATCGCCGGENCTCEHTCTSRFNCEAFVCATCVPCGFKLTLTGAAGRCVSGVDAPTQDAAMCVTSQGLGAGSCAWTFAVPARAYSRLYAASDCTGAFTKVCGLSASVSITGGPDADAARVTILVHYGDALVFEAVYVHSAPTLDWSDFPLTIANETGLTVDPTRQPHGGSITIEIDCCGDCRPTVACDTDCVGCCPALTLNFDTGGDACVFTDIPLLLPTTLPGATCAWVSASGEWTASCDNDGHWRVQYTGTTGGCAPGYRIVWEAFNNGEACITDVTGWELVMDDFCGSPDLLSITCAGGGCDCGDPGCDGCATDQCCYCAAAVAHITWTITQDTPDGWSCGYPGPFGGTVTFNVCDGGGTDDQGTFYSLIDSSEAGKVRIEIQPSNAGSTGVHPFINVDCKGGPGSHSTIFCGGTTVNVTMTITGC